MKTASQLRVAFCCLTTVLLFSCKNKDNVPADNSSDYEVNSTDSTSENSEQPYDTTAVEKDTINGTTPTGSNDRGQ